MEKKVVVDHYQVLGLPSGEEGAKLDEKEITKAYRSKALELHPDKRPNDPNANAEFQILNASYEILSDPKARKQFDSSLKPGNKPSEPPPTPEPSRPCENEDRKDGYLFAVGLFIFVLVPLVFSESRSRRDTCKRLGSFLEGFFRLRRRERMHIWSGMVWVGQYFKRRPPPPAQATTNQPRVEDGATTNQPRVEDDEDNQESRIDDHEEDIEDWVMV